MRAAGSARARKTLGAHQTAGYRGTFVVVPNGANAVVAIGHNHRHASGHVAVSGFFFQTSFCFDMVSART
jgi:hypothetical protein